MRALVLVLLTACAVPATTIAPPFVVEVAPLPAGDPVEGRRLFAARGCAECHGVDAGGAHMIHVPFVVRLAGTNLAAFDGDAARFDRAVRHGVRADGTVLVGMPSQEYAHLDDGEVAALFAFVQGAPRVERALPSNKVGPLAVAADRLDAVPLVAARRIDHAARPVVVVDKRSAQNGARLAASSCTGCHGEDLRGRRGLGPDLAVVEGWTAAQFSDALRTGRRPDGGALSDAMPWRAFASLSDDEVAALFAYLSTRRLRS